MELTREQCELLLNAFNAGIVNAINSGFPIGKEYYNDMIKNEYCFKNNILLIRIPYNYSSLSIEDLLPALKFILNNDNYKCYYEERGLPCN